MLWDLRTGAPILPISGHFQSVISSDFHRDGYQLATSSQDNTIKVFDIRTKNFLATMPSHLKLVSDVRFEQKASRWLISSSYDGTIKVHSTKDYIERYSLDCNNQKLSSVNVTADQNFIIATSMDKQMLVFSKSSHQTDIGNLFSANKLFENQATNGLSKVSMEDSDRNTDAEKSRNKILDELES